jgi:hypothetical protein
MSEGLFEHIGSHSVYSKGLKFLRSPGFPECCAGIDGKDYAR